MKRRVLVLEDDRLLANLVVELPQLEGYDAASVGPWQDAWHLLRTNPLDALLLDLYLGSDREAGWHLLDRMALAPRRAPCRWW